jgi:hypothetical protein
MNYSHWETCIVAAVLLESLAEQRIEPRAGMDLPEMRP